MLAVFQNTAADGKRAACVTEGDADAAIPRSIRSAVHALLRPYGANSCFPVRLFVDYAVLDKQ
eukprot:8577165-Pyramimonas_sp.AAC.2